MCHPRFSRVRGSFPSLELLVTAQVLAMVTAQVLVTAMGTAMGTVKAAPAAYL